MAQHDSLDDFSGEPLTPLENKKMRRLLRDQERVDWLWGTIRLWVYWGSAIVAAMYAGKDQIVKVFKALTQ